MPSKEKEMNFIEELQWRGLVKDVTDFDGLTETLKSQTTIYCGFDPTADSCWSFTTNLIIKEISNGWS